MKRHDSFLDELPKKSPRRIDIYVDGSLLYKSQSNPVAASGWGAVIVETYDDHVIEWTPSAAIIPTANSGTEIEVTAAFKALQAVQTREYYRPDKSSPEISLHSDTKFEILPKQTPNLFELRNLISSMQVKVELKSHDKSVDFKTRETATDEMARAHSLANRAAWAERVRLQGSANPGIKK